MSKFPRLVHTGQDQPGTYLYPTQGSHLGGEDFKSKNGSLNQKKKKNQAEEEWGAKENALPHEELQAKDRRKSTANTLQVQRTKPARSNENFRVFTASVLPTASYPH